MILPTDRDGKLFTHRPWVTTGLGLACVLAFAFTQITSQASVREGMRMLAAAVEYQQRHPYLALDPRLGTIVTGKGENIRDGGTPEDVPSALGSPFSTLEQTELDGLTNGGFDALNALPHTRYGVVPSRFHPLDLVTYPFVHARWIPLLGNLLVLYLLGVCLEGRWRSGPLLGLWILAGAAGGIVFTLRFPHYPAPLLGSGAALAGLAGAYAAEYWNRPVPLAYWAGSSREGHITVPGPALLLPWLLREALGLYSPDVLVPGSGSAEVIYWAHGAGLIFGAAAVLLLKAAGLHAHLVLLSAGQPSSRTLNRRPPEQTTPSPSGPAAVTEPWGTLRRGVQNDPGNKDLVQELWSLAVQSGRQREAAPELLRHIQSLTREQDGPRAHQLWTEFRRHLPDGPVPIALEVNLGRCLQEQGLETEAGEVLSEAAKSAGPDDAPGTLLRLARLLDSPRRETVVLLALGHPDLTAAKRREAEELLPDDLSHTGPPDSTKPPAACAEAPPPPLPFRAVAAVPLGLKAGRIGIDLEGAGIRTIPLQQIQGIAAAAVYDGGVEPQYVIDLVLDYPGSAADSIQTVRFLSADYDPRALFPSEPEIEDAFLSFAGRLLGDSGATWLLGANAADLRRYDTHRVHQQELVRAVRMNAPGP